MAYGMDDRVREQFTFAGGTIPFATLPVDAVGAGHTFLSGWGASGEGDYLAVMGEQWETGFGTLNAGATTLTRTDAEVYGGSSGPGARVNFNPGTLDLSGALSAELLHHANMREITVADSATPDIGAVRGARVVCNGTTTITSFGTKKNRMRFVRFSGIRTLTQNATSLILLSGANRTTAAGDCGVYLSDASGNWREHAYFPAGFAPATAAQMEAGTEAVAYVTPALQHRHLSAAKFWGSWGTTNNLLASYNVTSATDSGTGVGTLVIANDFSSGAYALVQHVVRSGNIETGYPQGKAAGQFVYEARTSAGTLSDPTSYEAVGYGDL